MLAVRRRFHSKLTAFQDKTNSVIDLYKDILRAVEDLATCSYTAEAFSELLGRVQAAVCILNICILRHSLTLCAD